MNIILRIASMELRGLFFSPVAWLVLIVFTISLGIAFAELLMTFYKAQYLGHQIGNLTQQLFTDQMRGLGLFTQVQSYAYLFIPLLTMGLVSRELASGSIKLLYSSPIKVSQIVFGKYLALLAYCLILIALLGLFAVAAGSAIVAMDVAFTFSGLIGLLLLLAAYAAIGLFMSCLTSYQVVAAISTLIVLAVLNYIGQVGQEYDFVRDLTYFLSIKGRATTFITGLVASKDVAYFLIVIAMMLSFSILKLRSGRESVSAVVKTARYAAVAVAVLVLGYVSSRPALWVFLDMTAADYHTLTTNSQATLARMTGPLHMTTYVNLLDSTSTNLALPRSRNRDLAAFEAWVRFKPDIEMNYVYYYDKAPRETFLFDVNPGLSTQQVAQKVAVSHGLDLERFLPPEEIGKQIDLRPEGNRLVRQLEYAGRKTFLRMFEDFVAYPSEAEVTAALTRLLDGAPKIAFLTGHGERRLDRIADADYLSITRDLGYRAALINQGFDVITLGPNDGPVPADVSILVIAGPTQSLEAQASHLREYIDRGGSVLFVGDPGSQPFLNPVLKPLGVQFLPGPLVQADERLAPDFVVGTLAASAIKRSDADRGLFDERSKVTPGEGISGPSLFDRLRVSMPGAVELHGEGAGGFDIHPVLLAKPKVGPSDVPVALALTRQLYGKEQRLMVVGDADFMSNAELNRDKPPQANLAFALEAFKWLSGGQFPVNTARAKPKDNALRIGREGIRNWKILFCGILPAAIALFGATLLIRRRRR